MSERIYIVGRLGIEFKGQVYGYKNEELHRHYGKEVTIGCRGKSPNSISVYSYPNGTPICIAERNRKIPVKIKSRSRSVLSPERFTREMSKCELSPEAIVLPRTGYNWVKLASVVGIALRIAKEARSMDRFFVSVNKSDVEILKSKLKQLAPGCLGKE